MYRQDIDIINPKPQNPDVFFLINWIGAHTLNFTRYHPIYMIFTVCTRVFFALCIWFFKFFLQENLLKINVQKWCTYGGKKSGTWCLFHCLNMMFYLDKIMHQWWKKGHIHRVKNHVHWALVFVYATPKKSQIFMPPCFIPSSKFLCHPPILKCLCHPFLYYLEYFCVSKKKFDIKEVYRRF